MDGKTIVALALLLTGCPDDTLQIPLCEISVIPLEDGGYITDISCAEGDREWDADIEDLDGWLATDPATFRKIGQRLEQCERNANP